VKILLISPVIDLQSIDTKPLLIPALGLYILKGMTPSEHEVEIVQEGYDTLDLDEKCDLVGISCMTSTAPRAYEIAKGFKERGKAVIMGGVHPTIMPEEVLQHADSIVIGEAEEVWNKIIDDFQQGKLKKIYQGSGKKNNTFVPLDYKGIRRGFSKQLPILTTRGCFYKCDFCSVKNIFVEGVSHIPISHVVRYIKESKTKFVTFLDDNIICDVEYAKDLFRAIKPLKIIWSSQAPISIADDPELLQLAVESGCKFLCIGVESIDDSQRQTMIKQAEFNSISDIEKAIKKIGKSGILVHPFIMFGFDTDTKEIFSKTIKFLVRNKVCSASFNILTPYPNIKLFNEMKEGNRLLTTDWKYYCHNITVFRPKNMTAYELQEGTVKAKKQFYSLGSIIARSTAYLGQPINFLLFLIINLAYKWQIVKEKKWNTRLEMFEFLKR